MKTLFANAIALIICGLAFQAQAQTLAPSPSGDSTAAAADTSVAAARDTVSGTFIAYYLHGDQRCATCLKLEAYSQEALETGFKKEMADSSLVWRVVNYDRKETEHYIDDYRLFTKAVILSRVVDGKEVAWRNLDKIWELVNNKDKFIAYIQSETRAFLEGDKADESGK